MLFNIALSADNCLPFICRHRKCHSAQSRWLPTGSMRQSVIDEGHVRSHSHPTAIPSIARSPVVIQLQRIDSNSSSQAAVVCKPSSHTDIHLSARPFPTTSSTSPTTTAATTTTYLDSFPPSDFAPDDDILRCVELASICPHAHSRISSELRCRLVDVA